MKSWIRRNRILADTFDGNFEEFLNLAIRETSYGRNAVGHFRSCHIDAEEVEESLSLIEKESDLIRKALKKHKGKRKLAANELGISERTLYRKIKELDL